ncbi:hypothetical protein U9M48_043462 [Paspalum notatum var. saurae]|uniref:Integrase catalytic domain-containing protein n=1 Tax=Paspalum notatum var. saurae TaxID=547442 RepID=A0AAQ3UXH9_PASNO
MEDVWIMDSGCSRHMTGHHKWFSSLNPVSTKEYITFGDNGQGKVLGVGSISLSAKLSLREVAFVRNLGFNLVSVSQLLDEGFEVRFKKGVCRVLDTEETLVSSLLPFGQVFRVDLTSVSGPVRCLVASPSADIWKWHRRLGHLSFDLLVRLSSMGLIRGLPKLKAEKDLVCHPCRHGKMVAASHILVSQVMTSYPGELLHMDIVGSAQVASVSGKWYVLVVVDDFSRFSWVFFMEFKDEAFGFARDLVLRLRNESHKAMRAIRSDNGGEFRNSWFENFCCDLGLEHQFSSPYTPPQNGVVERKNRTLVEMARTMLDEHMTQRRFWAEAVNTACYIANRIFLRAFLGKISYELRFGNVEEGTPIFEDEEDAVDDASSAEAGPAEDAGEVISEIVPSRQIQRDHPPHRMIGDIHQHVTRSSIASLAFFSHSAYVATFEPQDVSYALSDPNWVNAMHEELENFERNHIKQGPEGTFVHQAKYTRDIIKRFEIGDSKPMTTPMSTNTALDADEDGEAVDQKEFRGMIGSLRAFHVGDAFFSLSLKNKLTFDMCEIDSFELVVCFLALTCSVIGWKCVDNALIKGEIESQWIGIIALLV